MSVQFACAKAISALSTWGLKTVFRREAGNFPGKIALYVDPNLIGHLASKAKRGSIVVVGTNGKTTTTNMIADALERAGQRVICNRTGANLDSGVATSLLHAPQSDWGVFESDELWLARTLPQLQADYVLLLNLFRDQLDRCGEIDRIQDSIVAALGKSPNTVLLYNADDPLCATIANRASNRSVPFGVAEDMGLPQNTVSDAQMCQQCSSMLEYDFRQYGQLGRFRCSKCDFARPALRYAATDVQLDAKGLAFSVQGPANNNVNGAEKTDRFTAPFNGAYMVYNLLACAVAARVMGCPATALQQAIDEFDPQNGRLQAYDIAGRHVLLNLAKNPTGFNQNLKIVAQDTGKKAVAFFINDKEADGRDVSWLWDIDFEELAESGSVAVYASGIRGADMQVRLKYAGIKSEVLPDAEAVIDRISQLPEDVNAYLIANYTALPAAKAALDCRAAEGEGENAGKAAPSSQEAHAAGSAASAPAQNENSIIADQQLPAPENNLEQPVVIAHLFPDLLNLYGDGGNVRILEQRLKWRGIPVRVERVHHGQTIDLANVDLVMLGGGPDREQKLASAQLMDMKHDLRRFVNDGGALLAICGGYQILGSEWLLGDDIVEGLGAVPVTTRRPGTSANRLIDNIVLQSSICDTPVVGYENHAGRTYFEGDVEAFGSVVSSTGNGNNDEDKQDGVHFNNVIGTYLHGPLLSKNPQVADELLLRAIERCARRTGGAEPKLAPLDDSAELAANANMCQRLGVK